MLGSFPPLLERVAAGNNFPGPATWYAAEKAGMASR